MNRVKTLLSILLVLLLVLSFQNCVESRDGDTSNASSTSLQATSGGNGGPYTGKGSYLAFVPGHACLDANGVNVPAEVSRIEKDGDRYKVVFDECVDAQRTVDPSRLRVADGGTLIYNDRVYGFYPSPPDLSSRNFYFPEAQCLETSASTFNRTGIAPPAQGQAFTVDRHRVIMMANWFAERNARVYLEEVTRTVPLPGAAPIPEIISLLWLQDYSPILRSLVDRTSTWIGDAFKMTTAPPDVLGPPTLDQLGDATFIRGGVTTSISLECVVPKQ